METKAMPLPPSRQAFLEWYHVTGSGQILRTIEVSYLQTVLKFNYNQTTLQVGQLGVETLYIDSNASADFLLIDESFPVTGITGPLAQARPEGLPLPNESIDTLVLPHILEFAGDTRRQILNEAERVLKPEGRLFILSLNPWSLDGMLRFLPGKTSFWRRDFVSIHRVIDYLSFLKFETELDAAFCVSTARVFDKPRTLWTRTRAELSSAYAIQAIKRRYTLIPMEPSWINLPSLATGQLYRKPLVRDLFS